MRFFGAWGAAAVGAGYLLNWFDSPLDFVSCFLIASLFFALCLPILMMDFYRVTFNFFCVVYGFLLVVHLIRVAIAQNISAARAD